MKNKTLKDRFNQLKSLYQPPQEAPPDFDELKQLAKKFDPKMAKYLEEDPNA